MRTSCIAGELDSVPCDDLDGKEIQNRGDACVDVSDLFCSAPETNTMLGSSYFVVVLESLSHV